MNEKSRQGRRNRQRGQEGEREVCSILTAGLGYGITRTLGQERDGGNDIDLLPFRIQVKRRRTLGVHALMDDARRQCKAHEINDSLVTDIPVVAMRADNREWLVLMSLSDWMKLAKKEIL
jgi:hypothetical protein